MRIEWLPRAVRSFERQIDHVADHNPTAAIALGDAIETTIARLSSYPDSGRPGRVPGTRELVIPGTPYVVVYRVEPYAAVILRVLHGAQEWPERG